MKKFLLIITTGIIVFSLAGCSTNQLETTKGPKIVKIGVIAPISGPAANYGEDVVNSYNFIINEFNKTHKDIQAQLIIEDDKCDGKSAVSATQKLIGIDQVQVIVGGVCSVETVPAGKIAQENKILMISPISSAPEIANIGNYVYRFYNDEFVTKKLASYLTEKGAKKIFVLAENTDACLGYLNGIKRYFSGNIEQESYQTAEKDFSLLIKGIKEKLSKSDYFVFLPNSDGNIISIVKALDKEGLLQVLSGKIITNELINDKGAYEVLGKKIDGIKTTQLINLENLGEKTNDFMKQLEQTFTIQSSPIFAVLASEAMSLVLDAIVKEGYNADAIKNYFLSFNEQNQRDGIFGKYYFTSTRDAAGLDFIVYEVKDGQLVIAK